MFMDTEVQAAPTVREHLEALARAERQRATEIVERTERIDRGVVDHGNVLDVRFVCGELRTAWFELDELREYAAFLNDTLKGVLEENRRYV